MSSITDEATGVATARADFSHSFKGGSVHSNITLESDSYPEGELHELLYIGQTIGTLTAVAHSLKSFAETAGTEILNEANTVEFIEDDTEFRHSGVKISAVTTVNFDNPIVHTAQLHEALLELASAQLNSIAMHLDSKVLDGLRKDNPTPEDYLDNIITEPDKPVAENPPPGLAPEHWSEFVYSGAAHRGCSCGRSNCPAGVLKSLISYTESDLVAYGVSQEAAQAIVNHPVTKLLKESDEKLSGKLTQLANLLGVSLDDSLFGSSSYEDLLGGLAGFGVPRPSRNGRRRSDEL